VKKADCVEMIKQTHAPWPGMLRLVPADKLSWAPAKQCMTVGHVIKHLADNWSLLRMLYTGEWPFGSPEEMENAMKLENLPSCSVAEALAASDKDLADAVAFLEREVSEKDFASRIVTAPWGFRGEFWKGAIMARDHFMNHKMQLHVYLKILGAPVHTGTLYGM
jgi:hypothetical protein